MNLVLLRRDEIVGDGEIILRDRRAEHLIRVLDVGVGSSVRMGILDGPRGQGVVEDVRAGEVRLHGVFEDPPPPEPRIDLLLALPRPKVLKRLWAPLASLGVGRILLTNAAKVERNYFDTHWLEPEHFVPRLMEGLEQSGDTRLPRVSVHRRLKPLVEDELDAHVAEARRFVLHPCGASGWPGAGPAPIPRILAAIGPEGGWTSFELELLEAHGFIRLSLGWRTLRSDTACIAAVSALQALDAVRSV